ncbi:MAG: hypothetical protein BRC31_05620 [Actinobacteria bacterium QS_5_72_10]|nr:MAG: hypothetical protein BRC31_05620 [Actinobacteria bacterium QS_5_72_10]
MRLDHERPPAGPLRLLAAAVALLTRLPAGGEVSPTDLPRATAAFPAVGALVAGVAVAVRAGGEPLVGTSAATVAAVLAVVAVTGALHEDGLADVADGLWGARDPAARLAIMRDSHVGAYGVIAPVRAPGPGARIPRVMRLDHERPPAGPLRLLAAAAAAAHAGWAPVPLVVGGLAARAVGVVLRRRVGGITGDGYGAAIVVIQVVAMVSIAVLARLG